MVFCYHADIFVYRQKSYPQVVLTALDLLDLLLTIFVSSFVNQRLLSGLHVACLGIAIMLRI
jgi:membrane protein CcdC involved in cytochrome C biogenesis